MNTPRLPLILIALNGLTALGFGIAGLVAPASIAEAVALVPTNAFAMGEVRALYGGAWTAMGLILLLALPHLQHAAARERVRTIGLLWIGLPLGRGLGALLDGVDGGPAALYLAIEVLMIGTALLAVRLLSAQRG